MSGIMHGSQMKQSSHSSYSQHQSSSYYNTHNGQTSYGSATYSHEYEHPHVDTSMSSLRSHDINQTIDDYDFDSSMKNVQNGGQSFLAVNGYHGDGHSDNDSFRASSRQSAISRASEPVIRHKQNGVSQLSFDRSSTLPKQIYSSRNTRKTQMTQESNMGHLASNQSEEMTEEYDFGTVRNDSFTDFSVARNNGDYSLRSVDEQPEPPSEAIVEEERVNADGSTVLIRRVVTARTTIQHENEVPKIEVHISPATQTMISPPTSPVHRSDSFEHVSMYNEGAYTQQQLDQQKQLYGEQLENRSYVDSQYNNSILVDNRSNYQDNVSNYKQSMAYINNMDQSNYGASVNEEMGNRSVYDDSIMLYDENMDIYNDAYSRTNTDVQSMNQSLRIETNAMEANTSQNAAAIMEEKQEIQLERNLSSQKDLDLIDLLMFLRSSDLNLRVNAAGYLMHLAYNDDNLKHRIRKLDIIPVLVKLLDDENEDCHRNAAGALKNLSYGQFMDDNKLAIKDCGGIFACSRLLYKTSQIDVREHVTGILYNISSVQTISMEILKEALETVAMLIIIPLSGWEREAAEMGQKPSMISWSVLLRNSTGVIRNVSSAGYEARAKIRSIDGLIDSLVWILRAAIEQNKMQPESNVINNKIVENICCALRNLSYNIDEEIDRNVYLDALKVSAQDGSTPMPDPSSPLSNKTDSYKKLNKENQPLDAVRKGCLGMKKKPYVKKKRRGGKAPPLPSNDEGTDKPPIEQWHYLVPVQDKRPVPLGVELLWQQDTVSLYVLLLRNCINPITLEASAAAIHNLCAGEWNWSALLRVHVRLQKGLPPIGDLLTVDQVYVVRAVAYALRNLAIDNRNKWSIGKFTHRNLVSVLPSSHANEFETRPSEYTICAILSALQVIVYKNEVNARYVKNEGGIEKVIALTKQPAANNNEEKKPRVYSKKVVLEANRVLLYIWDFTECRDFIKQTTWSHSKAEASEKAYQDELKKKKNQIQGDVYADMERENDDVTSPTDSRRFVEYSSRSPLIGYGDITADEVGEQEPLVRATPAAGQSKKIKWYKRTSKKVKNEKSSNKKKKKRKSSDKSKLVTVEDDSFV